jgi:hypothetical protein
MPVEGQGQTSVQIRRLEVAIWPEYDRPEALVIYRIELPAEVELPATVEIPIPADTGEPHAIAVRGPEGGLLVAPYRLQVGGGWTTVFVEADSRSVQIEYYDEIDLTAAERRFEFTWPEGYPADEVGYEIQQPVGAEGMQIDPPPDEQARGGDGLTYHWAELGGVGASSSFNIELSYVKSTGALTVEQVQPPAPALSRPDATTGQTPDISSFLPWVLAALGLGFVGTGAFIYFRGRPDRESARAKTPRRRKPSRRTERSAEGDVGSVFCHVCGNRAGVGDRFCRHCGARLRG